MEGFIILLTIAQVSIILGLQGLKKKKKGGISLKGPLWPVWCHFHGGDKRNKFDRAL